MGVGAVHTGGLLGKVTAFYCLNGTLWGMKMRVLVIIMAENRYKPKLSQTTQNIGSPYF